MATSIENLYAIPRRELREFPDPGCPRTEGRWFDFIFLTLATAGTIQPHKLLIDSWASRSTHRSMVAIKEGMIQLGEENILVLDGPLVGAICLNAKSVRHTNVLTYKSFINQPNDNEVHADGIALRTMSRYSSSLPHLDQLQSRAKRILHEHPVTRHDNQLRNVSEPIREAVRDIDARDPYGSIRVMLRLLSLVMNNDGRGQVDIDIDTFIANCKAYDEALTQYAWVINQLKDK